MSKNLKPTKRKAFNFLRSYFDVLNELDNDKDKLDFLLSIINKQFLDEDPKELNFIVNLCYESQRHSIESSVKGWKRVNNIDPTTNPTTDPTTDPTTNPKEEEVKGEVKEEVKNIYFNQEKFLIWFNDCRKHIGLESNIKKLSRIEQQYFSELQNTYTINDFKKAFKGISVDEYYTQNKLIFPIHFLKTENFTKFLNAETKEVVKQKKSLTNEYENFIKG
jgi:hypothetical protein